MSGGSFVVHGRTDQTFTLTAETQITDSRGTPTSLTNLRSGTHVTGTYIKFPDGMLKVVTLKVHQAKESMATASSPSPLMSPHPKQRFAGKVVSRSGRNLVVHGHTNQTFTLTAETQITNSRGKTAPLADLMPGVHVTGTYMKFPDGTLKLVTLKISKK